MRTLFKKHPTALAVIATILALLGLVGYQAWAFRTSQRNAATRSAVQKLTAEKCASTKLFYTLINNLVEDTSPRFGSPPDGPPIKGSREKFIRRLYEAERKALNPLLKQGCDLSKIVPQ